MRVVSFVANGLHDNVSARDAICLPIEREGETIEDIALSAIVDRTQGYPYFFQEWEKHSWDAADIPCHRGDVDSATRSALAEAMSVKVSSVAPTRNNLIGSRPSMWCRIGCGQRAAFSGGLGCNL